MTKEEINKILEEFDEKFPCIELGCDNNGSIANQIREDEWEQEQCQYCDERRLPFKSFLKEKLELVEEKAYERGRKDGIQQEYDSTTGIF